MAKKGPGRVKKVPQKPAGQGLYTLEVLLIGGPVEAEFQQENPTVSRTIQIRGDQTLGDLHQAIFDAFDRFDEHMYQFEIGGKRPMDRKARRYTIHVEDPGDEDADETPLASLGLKPKQVFFYWFDFGDDWWHEITVVSVEPEIPPGHFPQVTARTGESPPQYPGLDDEFEDEDEEEEDEGADRGKK
jgi:hypothetical protein